MIKMMGMTPSSTSFSAFNWEASLVKTAHQLVSHSHSLTVLEQIVDDILRHGVNSITLRLARNFCLSASK